MTVIDRAHKIVLILLVVSIPAIFLVDLIAEIIGGEIKVSNGWQLYLLIEVLAIVQIRAKRWEADWIIVGGGLATTGMALADHFGSTIVMDPYAALGIVPVMGLIAVAISQRAPVVTGAVLGLATVILAITVLVDIGLAVDDVITKTSAIAIMFGLAAWLLYQLRTGYESQYEARDRFIATVSHELRTPLTAISGFADALVDGTIPLDSPESEEIVALLASQAHEAGHIVEDLLVAARTTAGQVTVEHHNLDLATQVSAVIDSLQTNERTRKRITIETEPALVVGDEVRIRQIVRNMVTNAVRHGGDLVTVRTLSTGSVGVVEVWDNGSGFGDNNIEALFAPYGRSDQTDLATGSIGLGLTVSRQLAVLMGGNLEAARESNQTVFRLTLPRPG